MNDMSSVIVPKSDQINADDLIVGPMTITIREVQIRGGQEQPVSIYFDGNDKTYRPCKSMSRVLVQAWGPDAKVYVGRSLTLYRDPTVKWAGMEVGGIRISHMSHIDGKLQMQLTATKGQRKPHIVMPLIDAEKGSAAQPSADERGWADKFIANVNRAPSAEKLETYVSGKLTLLDELRGKWAALHAECENAVSAKRASLADPFADDDDDDDDPFADDPSVNTEPESPSQEMLRKIRDKIAAAKNAKGLAAVEGEWVNRHRIAFDDATAATVDAEFAAKRHELQGGEG